PLICPNFMLPTVALPPEICPVRLRRLGQFDPPGVSGLHRNAVTDEMTQTSGLKNFFDFIGQCEAKL
ncbi:hypothetical protein, partial [Xanthomonas citri]|uniref:hypothetical protein n=1 Tax=Xanthomonas citri TaxID=346 RepID=UPI001F28DDE9